MYNGDNMKKIIIACAIFIVICFLFSLWFFKMRKNIEEVGSGIDWFTDALIDAAKKEAELRENAIVVSFSEPQTHDGYHEFEILDEGIISLKERKEKGGLWGGPYEVTWYFEILKPGKVRIKWTDPYSTATQKNANTWIDTYTINEDMSYSFESYYLVEEVLYLMCYATETDKALSYKGYFIDVNGDKRFYDITDTEGIINTVNGLYLYLTEHFSEYEPVKGIGRKAFVECQNCIHDAFKMSHFYNDFKDIYEKYAFEDMEFEYGKQILYAIPGWGEYHRFISCNTKETDAKIKKQLENILEIFGDDWRKYEP